MIDEGYPREAMFWVATTLALSIGAIQLDAPEADKLQFLAKGIQLLSDMGLSTLQDVGRRIGSAKALSAKIFDAANDIVNRSPEVID